MSSRRGHHSGELIASFSRWPRAVSLWIMEKKMETTIIWGNIRVIVG